VPAEPGADVPAATVDSIRALMLIRAYRVRGHLLANLDPLARDGDSSHLELDPASYGFSDADYDRPIYVACASSTRRKASSVFSTSNIPAPSASRWKARRVSCRRWRP